MCAWFRLRREFVFAEFSGILVAPSLVANILAPRSHGGAFAGLGFQMVHLLSCKNSFTIRLQASFFCFARLLGLTPIRLFDVRLTRKVIHIPEEIYSTAIIYG